VRGKKFNVKRRTVEEAMEGRHPNPPHRITNFLAEAFTAICQGEFDIEPNLNEKFPQITPTTINEFIQQWWSGKENEIF
jgi:hypothetical protein